ncbi:MAG: beta-ketoacyl-ACP synthase II [Elusimicrobiota bacterium]|nr:beta-ketoacyl-ACP synthase II [Elusimicrobiota bacterium]
MEKRRVVVTGIGIVSPIGIGREAYWQGLMKSESGAAAITQFDASKHSTTFACEVKGFEPEKYIDVQKIRKMDKFSQFGVAAATEAMEDSGLDIEKEDPFRCGAIVASGIGGIGTVEEGAAILNARGPRRISPFLAPKMIVNMAAGEIAIKFGLKGHNFSIVSACASSNHALGTAFRTIQYGDADVMLSGGAEAAITPLGHGSFCALKALSKRNDDPKTASRPFDKDRDGFIMGEGAGIFVLEEMGHAKNRGAHIYGEFAGFGATDDAYHITAPLPGGEPSAKAMEFCIKDAGLSLHDINYINAHGTSTVFNDKGETAAIKKVFGDYAYKIPVNSTKSMTGHMLGAASSNELAAILLQMENGKLHATINQFTPDPECDLDYVPNKPRDYKISAAISNSLGFGGHNATICVKTV